MDEAEPRSIETAARAEHGATGVGAYGPGDYRRFAAGVLVTALAILLAVEGLNVAVDPYGTFGTGWLPTAIDSDRSQKITLVEQLARPPQILILGSSRSRAAQPALLQELTGHTGFNAGVTSGNAVDEWAFAHLVADRFPDSRQRYLIFVDSAIGRVGTNPQLAADRRVRGYLGSSAGSAGESLLHRMSDYLSVQATRDSIRVVRACLLRTCRPPAYHADGSLVTAFLRTQAGAARHLRARLRAKLADLGAHPPPRGPPPRSVLRAFTRLLGWMNARGATPVLVLNPLQPTLLRFLRVRYGYPRHRWVRRYLEGLHRRYRFVFIDLSDVRTFGGSPRAFFDPTHVTVPNMRLMLRYIVAHDHGAL